VYPVAVPALDTVLAMVSKAQFFSVYSVCDNGDVLYGKCPGYVQLFGATSHALLLTTSTYAQASIYGIKN
jgi:hypothetical protein